jgi:hypothetical protein
VLLEGDPKETLPKLVKDTGASLLVTDMSPLRLGRTWKTEVAAAIAVPFHEVSPAPSKLLRHPASSQRHPASSKRHPASS